MRLATEPDVRASESLTPNCDLPTPNLHWPNSLRCRTASDSLDWVTCTCASYSKSGSWELEAGSWEIKGVRCQVSETGGRPEGKSEGEVLKIRKLPPKNQWSVDSDRLTVTRSRPAG